MEQLLPVLTSEAAKLAALVVTLLFGLLTKVIMERMKAGAARDAALELAHGAETVVRNLDQTLRPVLEAKAADGKLTRDDFEELKATAIPQLKDQLSNQALKIIESNSERVETVLSRAIEAAVSKKNEMAS